MTRFAILLFLAVAGLLLAPAMPATAQNDILSIIRGDYERRQQQIYGAPPSTQPLSQQRRTRARPRPIRSASPFATPARTAVHPAKPAVPASVFVHVLGDSIADAVADGLPQQLDDRPDIGVVPTIKPSSGIVRVDFFDWNKAITDQLASTDKIDAMVIMLGSNDRQPLRDEAGTYEFRSDEWRAAYQRRVDGLLALLKAKGIKSFWVGLPPMKSDAASADAVWFNELFRESAERAGAVYVDIWDSFVDADGQYSATGPDLNGQVTKLRLSDGVHFSKAGAQLAAHAIERELRRALGDAPAVASTERAPPVPDASETPATGPAEPVQKPEFGPVQPLEAAERAADGVLLGGSGAAKKAVADPSAEQVLVRGEALAPKAGRADDFQWPRAAAAVPQVKTSDQPVASSH